MSAHVLQVEMEKEHKKWALSTKVYGTLYPSLRFFLIVASGFVAAKESLTSISALAASIPILAVSVPIVTALDTWIRPRDKWRGFMTDRDDLAALRIRAGATLSEDLAANETINKEFAELRRRHRDENVW